MKSFAELAFTPAVQALQTKHGSRAAYARVERERGSREGLGAAERAFFEHADSFFLASVGATGWPYVQHRGGPPGFVRVLTPTRLAYAEFAGNRQYVSVGNVAGEERVSLLFMDYPRRRRLKLLGRLHFIEYAEAAPALQAAVALPDYDARLERIAVVDIAAFDWNCPQHIVPRYTLEELRSITMPAGPGGA